MKTSFFDPQRLDVVSFAAQAQELMGELAVADLPRLAASQVSQPAEQVGAAASVLDAPRAHWHARGWQRAVGTLKPQTWLTLKAEATVVLECQRCLRPVALSVHVERVFRFVEDEETAASLDDEAEEEVLALPRALDLHVLLEDELLLALPLAPRHVACSRPLPSLSAEEALDVASQDHPFAKLAFLRKSDKGTDDA